MPTSLRRRTAANIAAAEFNARPECVAQTAAIAASFRAERTATVAAPAEADDALDFGMDAMRPAMSTYRRQSDVHAEIGREARATGIHFTTLLRGSR